MSEQANETTDWKEGLSCDDMRELEYAERAVVFLLAQRKKLAQELAGERRIVRRLRRKGDELAERRRIDLEGAA